MNTPQSVAPENKARLAALIEDRANQPGWTYKRIATEAGVDVMTINAWRRGDYKGRPYPRTLRGLDRALGLADGSCERILNGEDPVELQADPVASVIAEIDADPNLTQEQKDLLIGNLRAAAQYARERARQLSQQAAERDRAS